MGAPMPALLAKTFIQHIEHNYIINILKKHHIIDYHRYVNDKLIIYNEDYTNIDNTLTEFNSIHPNNHIKPYKTKKNNKLNNLDITITNTHNTFTFDIYRNPPLPT
jgi:hypothetical protein